MPVYSYQFQSNSIHCSIEIKKKHERKICCVVSQNEHYNYCFFGIWFVKLHVRNDLIFSLAETNTNWFEFIIIFTDYFKEARTDVVEMNNVLGCKELLLLFCLIYYSSTNQPDPFCGGQVYFWKKGSSISIMIMKLDTCIFIYGSLGHFFLPILDIYNLCYLKLFVFCLVVLLYFNLVYCYSKQIVCL